MNYWITAHWPQRQGSGLHQQERIYMMDGRHEPGMDIAPGDWVLIYEAETGPVEIIRDVHGDQIRVPCVKGARGIITVARATSELEQYESWPEETYEDGTVRWWCWQAQTRTESTNGFVPLKDLNKVMGYSEKYNLRGFGDDHSGLKRLTKDQFYKLLALFKKNGKKSKLVQDGLKRKPRRGCEEAGESDAHRMLKEYVAANPAEVLGEEGLRTIKVESSFPTGDRADIVLQDQVGRIIGLEVEVDVEDSQLEGLLQALKYRAMLELTHEQVFGQGRAYLVAYTISKKMKRLCDDYCIEWKEIPRGDVKQSVR